MATRRDVYTADTTVLQSIEKGYVAQWEQESKSCAFVSDRDHRAYMLLHKTDFDGLNRVPFRHVVDFIHVPKDKRRQGIAHKMLTAPETFKLNLVAFVNSEHSKKLFMQAGFVEDEDMVVSRDDARMFIDKPLKIHGLVSRADLNGLIVMPSRFCAKDARYECRTGTGEWIRLKATNVWSLHALWKLAEHEGLATKQGIFAAPEPVHVSHTASVELVRHWLRDCESELLGSHLGSYLCLFLKTAACH